MRLLRSVSAAVLTAALAATMTPTAPPAAAAVGDPVALRMATYNIIAKTSPATFGKAVRAVTPYADVIGLQEVNGKDKVKVLSKLRGWRYYRYESGETASGQATLIWRSGRFALNHARGERLASGRYVGKESTSNGGYRNTKWAPVIRLTDRVSGQRISVINVHLPSGAIRKGYPVASAPTIYQMYVESVQSLVPVVQREAREWGQVFVTGDFNISWGADIRTRYAAHPFLKLRGIGMVANWATKRPAKVALLDQVYSSVKAVKTHKMWKVRYSDHKPVRAVYRLSDING